MTSEHPLAKYLGRREHGSVPQDDVKELWAFDMTPKYDQADHPPTALPSAFISTRQPPPSNLCSTGLRHQRLYL